MKIADEYLDPGCLMRGRADKDGLCSGPCPSCDRERYLKALRSRTIQSETGRHARQILGQYNAHHAQNIKLGYRFHGPHYVTYERREFRLLPYGSWARYRHSFRCDPEFVSWQDEPLWCFNVL